MDKPDFIGNWDPFGYLLRGGRFLMYIEKRTPINKDTESIEGIIKDFLGDASFVGEISPDNIKFTKSYPATAIHEGSVESAAQKVIYTGKKVGEVYIGIFESLEGKDGKEQKVYEKEFIMKAPPDNLDLKIHEWLTLQSNLQ